MTYSIDISPFMYAGYFVTMLVIAIMAVVIIGNKISQVLESVEIKIVRRNNAPIEK